MITPQMLSTARPGTVGLTFFAYQDVRLSEVIADDYRMKLHDARAGDKFRYAMGKESRTMQRGSIRRQYLVPLIRMSGGQLRALSDTELVLMEPTHYRVIWFAEAVDI